MNRLRKILFVAALVVGAAFLAPTQARAAFEILVYVNGVQQTVTGALANTATNGSSATDFYIVNGSVGGAFSINITSLDSNYPGTPTSANEANTTTGSITTTGTVAAGTTVSIVISESGWMAPSTAPLLLSSSAGGSLTSAGSAYSLTATNQGFLDVSSTLPGLNPAGTSTVLATANGSAGAGGTAPLIYNPSPSTVLAPGGVPFVMTEVFTYTFPTAQSVTVGDSIVVSGTVGVTAVPVPAGFVLALTGLPALGVGAWFRRRRQAVAK